MGQLALRDYMNQYKTTSSIPPAVNAAADSPSLGTSISRQALALAETGNTNFLSPSLLPHPLSDTPFTQLVPAVQSVSETKSVLKHRAVASDEEAKDWSADEKLAALTYLQFSYIPSLQTSTFVRRLVAQVRSSLLPRNPEDPSYARFLHSQADLMRGEIRSFAHITNGLQGAGTILVGPSGVGKSALVTRITAHIGERHRVVRGGGAAPSVMRFVPTIVLSWPTCGTLVGLLSELRFKLIAEFAMPENAFADFARRDGREKAIATCVILSVGLVVVDGGCSRSVVDGCRGILDFLSKLQSYAGIPTLITCTYPFYQALSRGGPTWANLGNCQVEYLDLLPADKNWTNYCNAFWKLGLLPPSTEMPTFLPPLMWQISRGNMRVLSFGFRSLLLALHEHPKLLSEGALSEGDAAQILKVQLRRFAEPMKVLALFQGGAPISDADLWAYGDYLPYEAFSKTPSGDFERRIKLVSRRKTDGVRGDK